jgi:hypothetical protein
MPLTIELYLNAFILNAPTSQSDEDGRFARLLCTMSWYVIRPFHLSTMFTTYVIALLKDSEPHT